MKLLIIGGTIFLGRHLVEAAHERAHEVTLFNRGLHEPDLFPEVEKLRGDRLHDLSSLHGRHWDAVIDTCGYIPKVVRASAALLADAVEHYTFISSLSVYPDWNVPGTNENSPVKTLADEEVQRAENIKGANPVVAVNYGEMYGGLKALCEREVENALPGRALVIRPGLIVGPHDYSDRFTYWVHRVAEGGEVLAPGRADRRVQFVDARDLARWNIALIEEHRTGVFNATGPDYALTMQRLLEECKTVSRSDARFTWLSEDFLLAQGAEPWSEVPLWIPEADDILRCDKAISAGLTFRPIADTIRDTLDWDATRPRNLERRAGLRPERETQLLRAWHNRNTDAAAAQLEDFAQK